MSQSASMALRKAIYHALQTDPVLVSKVGNKAIYDEAPGKIDPPYITFGQITSRDWSASQDKGDEHDMILQCWSMQPGTGHVLDLAADIIRILDDSTLQLEAHHLVLITYLGVETRRENKGRYAMAALRFKVLTERDH